MLLQAADARYRRQAQLAVVAQRSAQQMWRQVPLGNLDAWDPRRIARRIAALQMIASHDSDAYVTAALKEQGTDPAASGRVNPGGFVGVAGDGRSLTTLFDEPRIQVKTAIGQGTKPADAFDSAMFSLTRMAVTAVQDVGRVSVGVATVARRHADGQVRQLNPPSCARCAILAGRWYRWDAGFDRHVNCDCIGIPVAENVANDLTTDPMEAFRAGQIGSYDKDGKFRSGLSRAETQALHDGADIGQVVNAHRGGIQVAGVHKRFKFTREGITRRGIAGKRLIAAGEDTSKVDGFHRVRIPRITPEQIYRDARDREDAIRLLRRFGYLI